jgi:protein-S-isoprenylcysteine O-methyltransferase Ste14
MSEIEIHHGLSWLMIGLGVATFISLLVVTAPYGRHYKNQGWGPQVPNRTGWILMEIPSVLVFACIFFQGESATEFAPLALLCLWQCHYVHRTFIFPFRMKTAGKFMPILVMSLGAIFNCFNSYINARWISELGVYEIDWLTQPCFLVGLCVFLLGFGLNVHSDSVLFNLRGPGETGYKVPQGGAYRWVSSPNYLGELLEWLGWAIASWSFCGLAFFIYTAANLVPRAMSNHRWCQETFPDYPSERRRIIPGIF